MNTIATDKKVAIVGLGKTGLSCVRFLSGSGCQLIVLDSRENPPGSEELAREFPNIPVIFGKLCRETLCSVNEIVASPGVPLSHDSLQAAAEAGVFIRGDIDLFVQAAKAPIVAITGSNGKSSVTTLVGEMAKQEGLQVGVGGNLGEPALDLLGDEKQLYVLELSSFQLETTHRLNADVCVLLNLSEDHMDRYDNKMKYLQAKQRIFFGAKHVVVNADQTLSQPLLAEGMKLSHFGLDKPDLKKFSTKIIDGKEYLVEGFNPFMAVDEMVLKGQHNISNALAATALARAVDISMSSIVSALKAFKGLPHRCQWVANINGIDYIDDSKGTNPGATKVAIESLGGANSGKVVLIAGGEGKELDMSELSDSMEQYGRAAVLIGKDAPKLEELLKNVVITTRADSMKEAVQRGAELAQDGDLVLLSPACASFDMFKSFEHRGDVFQEEVAML